VSLRDCVTVPLRSVARKQAQVMICLALTKTATSKLDLPMYLYFTDPAVQSVSTIWSLAIHTETALERQDLPCTY